MRKRRSRGIVRVPTVTAMLAISAGLVLVATGGLAAALVGVILLVGGGVELALDFERTMVPPRRTAPVAPVRAPARPPEDYEELGAA